MTELALQGLGPLAWIDVVLIGCVNRALGCLRGLRRLLQ
jgi:hypothetical protein